MILYRVEGKHYDGPYSGFDRIMGMGSAHSDHSHPSPWEEGLWDADGYDQRGMEHCCFDSLEALHEWFGGWEGKLKDGGYAAYRFDCPEGSYAVGEFQAVFNRDKATLIGEVAW